MAQEIKIPKLVGEDVFANLEKFNKELEASKNKYVEYASELSNGIKIKVDSISSYNAKVDTLSASIKKLAETQNKMASLQENMISIYERMNAVLPSLTKVMDSYTSNVNKASEALANNAKSTSSNNQALQQASQALSLTNKSYTEIINSVMAYDNNAKELNKRLVSNKVQLDNVRSSIKSLDKEFKNHLISQDTYTTKRATLIQQSRELTAQSQQLNNILKSHATVVVSAAGSYDEMNAAVLQLEKRFKKLSASQRSGTIGQGVLNQINQLKTELKNVDSQMGNYQRNVGNYKSHWDGLGFSIQQVARELPSLAIGWNTFFLAISNNLPILADELQRARIRFKELTDQGIKAPSVFKQVISSIFSWQTALVAAVTILSVYGKDIIEWVSGLFKANDAINKVTSSEHKLSIIRRQGLTDTIKERTELRILYNATQDASRSIDERRIAIDKLKKDYPSYFEKFNEEEIIAGKAATAYYNLTNQLIANARAKRTLEEITNLSNQAEDAEFKRLNKVYTLDKKRNELSQLRIKLSNALIVGNKAEAETIQGRIRSKEKEVEEEINGLYKLTKAQQDYTRAAKSLEESVKPTDLITVKEDKSNYNKQQTENSKLEKEQERHEKYIQKLRIEINAATATAMQQAMDSDLAEVETWYSRKIGIIKKGEEKVKEYRFLSAEEQKKAYNGEYGEELQLISRLEAAKAKKIQDINEKYNNEIAKANIENRIASINVTNSTELSERIDLLLRQNEILRQEEIKEAKNKNIDILDVESKYARLRLKILEDASNDRINLIKSKSDKEKTELEILELRDYNLNEEGYKKGLKSRENYEDNKFQIQKKYTKLQIEAEIKSIRAMLLLNNNLSKDQISSFMKQLKLLEGQLNALDFEIPTASLTKWSENFSSAIDNMQSKLGEYLEGTENVFGGIINILKDYSAKIKETGNEDLTFADFWKNLDPTDKIGYILGGYAQLFDGITNLMGKIYDVRIENIEKEQEANQKYYDEQVARIDKLAEAGTISEKKAEADKRAFKEETNKKDKELEREKAELQQKQARWNKANAITQSIIATSLAVTEALPNLVLAALVATMGAIQTAAIIAQPIPKYAEGTKDKPHKGGLAVVGDGGKSEAIMIGDKIYSTPSIPTLTMLPAGAEVFPDIHRLTVDDIRKMPISDLRSSMLLSEMKSGKPFIINNNFDTSKIEGMLNTNNKLTQQFMVQQRRLANDASFRDYIRRNM